MKVSAIPLLASCLAVTSVLAAPTPARVIIVSSNLGVRPEHIRIGLTAPPLRDAPIEHEWMTGESHHGSMITKLEPVRPHRTGCNNKFRNKALEFSNKLRTALGLEPIATDMAWSSKASSRHHQPIPWEVSDIQEVDSTSLRPMRHTHHRHPHPPMHLQLHRPHGPHHHFRGAPFVHRLTFALMALGKWEGRAVAFVLGCGLGVLLRMVWVVAVVLLRSLRGRSEEDEEVVEYVVFEEHLEDPELPSYPSAEEEKAGLKSQGEI